MNGHGCSSVPVVLAFRPASPAPSLFLSSRPRTSVRPRDLRFEPRSGDTGRDTVSSGQRPGSFFILVIPTEGFSPTEGSAVRAAERRQGLRHSLFRPASRLLLYSCHPDRGLRPDRGICGSTFSAASSVVPHEAVPTTGFTSCGPVIARADARSLPPRRPHRRSQSRFPPCGTATR